MSAYPVAATGHAQWPLDVTTLGEGQLRLCAPRGIALEETDLLELYVAGTEANVVGLLSRLGRSTGMVTALPETSLGRRVSNEFRKAGIDESHILWRPAGRVATYYLEPGDAPVPGRVFYDRQHSCFAEMTVDEVDWDYLTSGLLLHLTGITAAINDNTWNLVEAAVDKGRGAGQQISFDINHRENLWSARTARERLSTILPHVSVAFCSRRDAAKLFGIECAASDVPKALSERFGIPTVVVSDASRAVHCVSPRGSATVQPPTVRIVDRIGAGDASVGGFLYGYLDGGYAIEEVLKFGVACSALTLTRHGDQLFVSLKHLNALVQSFWSADSEDISR